MRKHNKRAKRKNSIGDFLSDLPDVPLVAYRGFRRRLGYGSKFLKKHENCPVFFEDKKLMREWGERAYSNGGKQLMHDLWNALYDRRIIVGDNWDGIGGWYK